MKTKICETCRFWSQMVAQSIGCRPVEALCLDVDSPNRMKMVTGNATCIMWAENTKGAVDQPGVRY